MSRSFEGEDMAGASFWGVELSGARLRDVNLTGAVMKNVWLIDVDIDGLVERLVINGVDVTDFVNAHDPWQPLRGMLRPTDRAGLLAAWEEIGRVWSKLVDRARLLTAARQRQSVNGEWSFVETLRHLVFVIDKWFFVPIENGSFQAAGLPNRGSVDHPWPGLRPDVDPSFEELLELRAEQASRFRAYLEGISDAEVTRIVDVPENGPHSVIDCLYTVFEEEFEHHRYAARDLATFD